MLQDRLDRLEAERSAVPPAASAAAAQIAPAATASAAAPTSTPAPAPSQVAAAPQPSWSANTKIGGKAYINVSNIDEHSDGQPAAQNGLQTDVKRFYLTVDHRFSDIFSSNLTTDFRYGTNGISNDTTVYVKKAYIQAAPAPEFFVRVGSADLPWVPFAESVYGFRFVENVLIDRTKYGTSADWGVHIGGSIADGLISYAASAINGAGYKTLSRNSNTIDLEGRVSVQPAKWLVLAAGGYTGKRGKGSAAATPHRATRLNALAAYTGQYLHLGLEYFRSANWNNVTTPATDRTDGWSAFGSYALTRRLSVFGRYDRLNPDQRTNAPLRERYFNVGANYQPVDGIDVAFVYKHDNAANGFVPTSNGVIGGNVEGNYDEIGVFSQFRF